MPISGLIVSGNDYLGADIGRLSFRIEPIVAAGAGPTADQ